MGRPRTGAIRERGGRWLASVPRLEDPRRRHEASFASESVARAWLVEQLERLSQGLAPELPRSQSNEEVVAVHGGFEEVARRWHAERYFEMERGGAERQANVIRDMELHLFGPFARLFELDLLAGRQLVKDWLRVMSGRAPRDSESPLEMPRRVYSRQTVTQLLWMLRQVIEHAGSLGVVVPDYASGRSIAALQPLGRTPRKAPLVDIAEAYRIAGGLHVVHQLVLWLLRVAGLRISEAYGLDVADFIVDDDGSGYLLVTDLGGRAFRERGADGTIATASRKVGGKTDAATRLVPLPRQLTELIRVVIDAFHTDVDGKINPAARLVPVIQSSTGGQAGFRSALGRAAGSVFVDDADLETGLVAHDLRKGFATDLAWASSISDLLARRTVGHRAGGDVFSLVYTLDLRLKDHLAPVARLLEAQIERATPTLMAPTAVRPLYATTTPVSTVAEIDSRLESAAWQVAVNGETVGVAEAARILQMAESTTRRLFGTAIPAMKGTRGWRARLRDVEAFRDRNAGRWTLPDLASSVGVGYHVAFQTMRRLGLEPGRDAHDGRVYVLDDAEANKLRQALEAAERVRRETVGVGEAAAILGVAASTVR